MVEYNEELCAHPWVAERIFMHEPVIGARLPSVMALAYLGDARHSLYIRRMLLNEAALRYVTEESQAEVMRGILDLLLPDEHDVYKRAANSGHLNRPRHSSAADYRAATGFEAVIGMLYYIGDEERIEELLSYAYGKTEAKENENDTED